MSEEIKWWRVTSPTGKTFNFPNTEEYMKEVFPPYSGFPYQEIPAPATTIINQDTGLVQQVKATHPDA